MTLKLRPARPDDATALTAILHRGKASWGYPDDKMAEFREHWRISEEKIAGMTVLVAERDGVPCAFLSVGPRDDQTLLVDDLFVDPTAQGQGVGSLLLLRAEDIARSQRLSRLYLESDIHAEAFYLKHGFKTVSHKPSEMIPGKQLPLMEKTVPSAVHVVSSLDIRLDSEKPWGFELENKEEIDRHWEKVMDGNQQLWDGRVLKLVSSRFHDGVFSGRCCICNFSSFLAWRDWGAPDPSAFNLFGSAVLRSSDGALLYGVMSNHTANAGKVYPPGGNLDPDDVRADGTVDIKAAIYRELEEETGLSASAVQEGELLIAFDGPRISVAQVFNVPFDADDLARQIMDHSLASQEQELADIRIIREIDDLHDPMIVPYAREIGFYVLGARAA
ncbi:GNAT family N-acetyltransferase [Roseibium sediminis]|uniref:GNAT family N-acetyltransferase n=1 Tax=Roseibium sediminis TaxID=1775174 RepID=UPI00123E1903|nr:GNAT family N-acetyltransferase [Roseibium sediminis]